MFPKLLCNHICNKDKIIYFSNHFISTQASIRRGEFCHGNQMMPKRGYKMCAYLNSLTNVTIKIWEEFKYFTFKFDLAEAGRH